MPNTANYPPFTTKAALLNALLGGVGGGTASLSDTAFRLANTDPSTITDNGSRLTTGNVVLSAGGGVVAEDSTRYPAYSSQSLAVAAINAAAAARGAAIAEVIRRISNTNVNNWGGG